MGAELNYFVHERALCESVSIGAGSRVWAFAHILPGAVLGKDCNVCDNVFIENDVIIGDRVTLKCGVQVWDGITLEDDVFVGPNVTFTNDLFPRSKVYPDTFLRTVVQQGASLGANCTILPGVTIGEKAMVGAGAVVTRSVPPGAIVVGNPAKVIGHVDAMIAPPASPEPVPATDSMATSVNGVTLHIQREIIAPHGSLTVNEFERDVPFKVQRCFLIYNMPGEKACGEHAHFNCHQFLIAAKGSVRVIADDGAVREDFLLDTPNKGIYIPPMTWSTQYQFSSDAVLMVFASNHYDPKDDIRNYDEFVRLSKRDA
ncbi:WxcM-like domain-containing protein [Pseudomonas sp. BW16M2]|uniref:WxcM-like domain-containing protein n=1 Tax=Pseudomonas sp. BW16M2 TaxID=2745489 RepID=UPI001644077A|nr:WxcM-like domain-containing protein [Pseudomonas sp. BW16M2]MBC3434989.1 WxcM-like domain-containing protein [Pseudomonas sp. BW16M2]